MPKRKRHDDHEEHVNHERWLVSYADFITLLFAFFVVMFAVSQVDTKKSGRFTASSHQSSPGRVVAAGIPIAGQRRPAQQPWRNQPFSAPRHDGPSYFSPGHSS